MSRNFIGSKIAIITKSQCRYVGTIIGIDAQTSSIILGNVKCLGTENRPGNLTNGEKVGTITPIMQFANSDIEDLKIVDEEQTSESSQQQSRSMPVISSPPSSSQQPSIHDDPAIVSAVISSSNKDNKPISSISSQLMHNLHHMTLSDEQSKTLPKNDESRIRLNSGELGPSWSLLSPSKWENNNNSKSSSQHHPGNKSKFFDDFTSNKNNNNTDHFQSNRYHQRPSNTHSTQTLRGNGGHYNDQEDDSILPVRQPFFSDDHAYPQDQQQQLQQQQQPPPQQHNRHQNGNMQHQQRYFYNNRRPQMPNQQRRTGGGNRETFQNNTSSYDNDFDFETSNRKFNKIASEDEFKQDGDLTPNQQPLHTQIDNDSSTEYAPLYDKKKSFFDNVAITESSDAPITSMYNRSKNKDTFGNEGYQRQQNRPMNSGYRRPNNNYRQQPQQQQYGNDDFYYRQQNNNNNNNGYHYRY